MDQGKDICKRYNMFFSSTIKICTCTLKTKSTLNKKGAPWTFSLIKTAYHKYCTGVAYVYSKTKLKWVNVKYLKEKPNKWNLLKKGGVNSIISMDFFYSSESIWKREGHLG